MNPTPLEIAALVIAAVAVYQTLRLQKAQMISKRKDEALAQNACQVLSLVLENAALKNRLNGSAEPKNTARYTYNPNPKAEK